MPSGMSRILFMISKMNILGPIYMKDFSYKKMGTSALPYSLAILISGKGGRLARGFSERGRDDKVPYIFLSLGGERLNSKREWDNMVRIREDILSRKT
jgi:hypothetical protein